MVAVITSELAIKEMIIFWTNKLIFV